VAWGLLCKVSMESRITYAAGALVVVLPAVWIVSGAAPRRDRDLYASTLLVDRDVVAADGIATVQVTVEVRDFGGRAVPAIPVRIEVSGSENRIAPYTDRTDSAGRVTVAVRSTAAEVKMFGAFVADRPLPHRLAVAFVVRGAGPRVEILERSVVPW